MSRPLSLSAFFKPTDPAVKPPRGRVKCIVDESCLFVSSYRSPTLRKHLVEQHSGLDLVLRYLREYDARQRLARSADERARKRPRTVQLSEERTRLLNRRAALMVLLDGWLPEDLQRRGILELLRACEPRWTPPGRRVLVEECIPAAHADVRAAVARRLQAAPFITIAFGAWTWGSTVSASVVALTPRCSLPLGVFRRDYRGSASARALLDSVMHGEMLAPHIGKVCALVSGNGEPALVARESLALHLGCLSLRCHAQGVGCLADSVLHELSRTAHFARARDVARRIRDAGEMGQPLPPLEEPRCLFSTLRMLEGLLQLRGSEEGAAEGPHFWDGLEGLTAVLEAVARWQGAVESEGAGLADLFHHFTHGWGQQLRLRATRLASHLPEFSRAVMRAVRAHQGDVCPHAATAAYFLDPRYAGTALACLPNEAGIRQSVVRSRFHEGVQPQAARELEHFVGEARAGRLRPVSDAAPECGRADAWWSDAAHADAWPTLQPVALRLMSCRVHAKPCESVWTAAARVPRGSRPDPELCDLNAVLFTRLNAGWLDGEEGEEGEGEAAPRWRIVARAPPFPDLVAAAAAARARVLGEAERVDGREPDYGGHSSSSPESTDGVVP